MSSTPYAGMYWITGTVALMIGVTWTYGLGHAMVVGGVSLMLLAVLGEWNVDE